MNYHYNPLELYYCYYSGVILGHIFTTGNLPFYKQKIFVCVCVCVKEGGRDRGVRMIHSKLKPIFPIPHFSSHIYLLVLLLCFYVCKEHTLGLG